MAGGIWKLNKRVKELFEHEVHSGSIHLPLDDYKKFILYPRRTSAKQEIEFDDNTLKLARPQALIICMNPAQVKNLIGRGGANSGLIEIMKGNTRHPYPPKCHDPYSPFDDGANRPVARVYFILDEDDLNRSNNGSVTERLQFGAPPEILRRLDQGRGALIQAGAAAAAASGSQVDPVLLETDDEPPLDDEEEESAAAAARGERGAREEVDEDRMRNEFRNQMDATGVRSAVRGVVALTATPAACGHELSESASQVKHHICVMQHPSNYVGYEFTAAGYAERTIKHVVVPDRKQIVALKKAPIYREVLQKYDWWNNEEDQPMPPFKVRGDGAITVRKADLSNDKEGGDKSSRELCDIVNKAQRKAATKGDKVLESDGVGIALMLEDMSRLSARDELERRALIISNFTRTDAQKLHLAQQILEGNLVFEDGTELPESCVCDLFILIFDHKNLRIMWRGSSGAGSDDDVAIPPDHDSLAVLNAIRDASTDLYNGCRSVDRRSQADPSSEVTIETLGACKVFRSSFININHAYTALHLYAHRRRQKGSNFKLKTVCLAGDLGGRGVNFKPHGFGHDPTLGTSIVPEHQGYLTDMFFMFDATVNRQITTHGEYILQAIGRLCTLVNDEMLARMAVTPPRLFTSISCYNIIGTFARGVDQWVKVMNRKQSDESMKDAVVRSIRSQPEDFRELWMIYVVPHTDARWAKKELWVRTSRLMRADKAMGEGVRASRRMPPTPGTLSFGLEHNPDRDNKKRMRAAISKAEDEVAAGDEDEPGSEEEPVRRSRRRVAPEPNALQMREKFAILYTTHPQHAKTTTQQPMPKFNSTIWVKWDADNTAYYPVRVCDIEWIPDHQPPCFQYDLEFTTNDDYSPVPAGAQKHVDVRPLDQSMMPDWSYQDPRTMAAGP